MFQESFANVPIKLCMFSECLKKKNIFPGYANIKGTLHFIILQILW